MPGEWLRGLLEDAREANRRGDQPCCPEARMVMCYLSPVSDRRSTVCEREYGILHFGAEVTEDCFCKWKSQKAD